MYISLAPLDVKPVYKRIHSQHHEIGSAITALGTAFGDAADIGLCFVAFHLVLGIFLSYQERWNLAAVVLLVVFEVGTNILGHTGYEAPLWLHALVTAGVGLTPLAATSKAHYLHHVDPRYNRALYFTWWDRVFGTYRDEHPLIFPGAK
ncbi:g3594 [Coccomyxa elongata]